MKYYLNLLKKNALSVLGLLCLVACGGGAVAHAQNSPEPTRREHLLNNLKLLIWAEPKAPDVTIKLRVHSGAAFDPQGKEGVAALLADIMFPDEQTRLFFEEELGGNLRVESNQDFIEITARGSAENFERILDTVRIGAVTPPITPENFKKVQTARLKMFETEIQTAATIADTAVIKRLYGDFFPYGRSTGGTPTSLTKIDRVDLIQARERFLTADNATLAIIGNVDPKFTLRAVKQFFGNWNKSDKLIPATFRQPEIPDKQILIVKQPDAKNTEIRFALRGAARNSGDYAAALIAATILQERWQKKLPAEMRASAFVRHEAHVLPGSLVFGASVSETFNDLLLKTTQEAFVKILSAPVSEDEINRAKTTLLNTSAQTGETGKVEKWLDAETFKLTADYDLNNALSAVTAASAQVIMTNWQKQTPAIVAVTGAEGNASNKN